MNILIAIVFGGLCLGFVFVIPAAILFGFLCPVPPHMKPPTATDTKTDGHSQ